MSYEDMEEYLGGARKALAAAHSPENAQVLAPVAIAHALVVIAECAYRQEMRAGL